MLLVFLCVSCVREYEVVVINQLAVPTLIEIAQYHSRDFDGTTPREFSDDLLLGKRWLMLGPGERRTVVFNDAGGGYWLRWHQVEPWAQGDTSVSTLDLTGDDLTITIGHRK